MNFTPQNQDNKVNFHTLKGIDGYQTSYPGAFDGLNDADLRIVISSIHSNVLEGWEPTYADVQDSVDSWLRMRHGQSTAREEVDLILKKHGIERLPS